MRRHRQHHQPADRRRPGARRPGAGHRPGALGGGGLRRLRAPSCPGRSSTTCCRPRPTRSASSIDHTTSPSTTNTLGTKGVGEAGTIASTPAVVNAVVDAVRHLGVNDIQMPCTPERVWKAIQGGGSGGSDRGRGDAALRRRRTRATRSNPAPQHGRSGRMIPAQFDYVAPTSVEDALAALAEHGDDAKILAGGQSLLPVLRMRLNAPEMVIDLGRIESLRGIRDDGDALVIGAMTTHSRWAATRGRRARRADHQAIEHLADAQIRHRGTFGGALAHADPGGRPRGPGAGAGRGVRDRRERRHPHGRGGRLLRRPVRDRDRRRRDPHRGADPEAHRLGRALREVRADRAPVADRRGRGRGAGRRRHHRRGPDRAHQHGHHPAAGHGGRAGAGRAAATEDGVRAAAAGPRRAPTRRRT